ncbi:MULTISPECIES: type IV pilus modification protein PilV [Pseudomonas syringae group]|uniref:Type IV pilus assembly protein PilV n=4 Tax=Pseudomonas syringae group TaxID=136849 RepID=F3GAI7_PSESJ|nr:MULTISPECIES: type IV pilus modification protein PilV [Pseudomonas syringae group]EGH44087.1 type IV pilus assembly protein PilV [Pseudomonas syringae pv. pisi str. 1704B]RMU72308.1 Type IV pilus assembly protein PilV [Pseudomonas syringae pv. aptata]KMY02326.1 pilus assembly protein PilV [Pseudomonas syringae KCTC 12500]KPY72119.1 Type IV pilus assembly protein PilV [Pseudomonas syringae pv. syringae]POR84596.1 type IV pilus modification protein PilV [Pseudomonas syringae pv. syringae]
MAGETRYRQTGMTLIEVLVSVLILAIGLLGAAAIQLNALKYTDSSAMTSQASFIAYDMMDRIRANVDGNASANGSTNVLATYNLPNLDAAPAANLNKARDQDLFDFKDNIGNFASASGTGSIVVSDSTLVTITIGWSDNRAAGASNQATGSPAATPVPRSFQLVSRIGVNP